jgi:hypothetical protein
MSYRTTLFLGEINTGTWYFRRGKSKKIETVKYGHESHRLRE